MMTNILSFIAGAFLTAAFTLNPEWALLTVLATFVLMIWKANNLPD